MKRICLRGLNGKTKGRTWEAEGLLRVGRLHTLEVVLEDASVSRCHAELRVTDRGWRIADLGSTNGTRLNGVRLSNGQWPVRARDLLQFGEVAMTVETLVDGNEPEPPPPAEEDSLHVEATAMFSWDEAMESLVFDGKRNLRPGDQLMAVLRASKHLANIEGEKELLDSILEDAVDVLDAQRVRGSAAEPSSRPAPASVRAWRCAVSSAASRSSVRAPRKTPNWLWRAASAKGRWRRCCACCCGRRAANWACCTSTEAPSRSRSPRKTCTSPTPWPPTSRPASNAPNCSASNAICS
jgi:hypothetical protein